jgi:hypothetical protein
MGAQESIVRAPVARLARPSIEAPRKADHRSQLLDGPLPRGHIIARDATCRAT